MNIKLKGKKAGYAIEINRRSVVIGQRYYETIEVRQFE
jgi:hypothetical protein